MTTTPNLPPEFTSGNSIPVERATITRERMAEIQLAAYQAGREAGLSEGFDVGFAESGECWNGEHPTNLQTYPAYQDNKKKALVALKSDAKGGV